jgi:periplasmic divalent cation tolerance protein
MSDKLVALVTCGNAREAGRIARTLVEEGLAACVNIQEARVRSVYWWKGKVEQAEEVMLFIKTSKRLFPRLESRVRELHSYDVAEIIALPIAGGSRPYMEWMEESLGGKRR